MYFILSSRVTALTDCIKHRDETTKKLEGKVAKLEFEADKVEQYSRRANLRFSGLPETESENTTDKLLELINNEMCPDTPVHKEQVERSHRLGPKMDKNGKPRHTHRAIIVRFASEKVRDDVYRARFQLKDRNASARNKVYVNEDLTATRGAIAYHARQLKKAGHITDCWTTAGKVLIKTKDGLIVNITVDSELCAYGQV